MTKKRIGYACLIGPTNAGKSTLLNTIFKKKISIVSHKVQTTNFAIEVVKNHKNNIIFMFFIINLHKFIKKREKIIGLVMF